MKNTLLKAAALAVAMAGSSVASAGLITDTVDVNTTVGWFGSTQWTHDLNDNGFALGSATSATLSIEFSDDKDKWLEGYELATIVIGVIDFLDGALVYHAVNDFSSTLGINSLAGLNADGLLDVKVWSDWGDFKIGKSTLDVVTADVASVPEPGTLALLGLGLVGMSLRRRKA